MLVLLTDYDYDDFKIDGIYELTPEQLAELDSLKARKEEIRAAYKPVWGWTSITSVGPDYKPEPTAPPHDVKTCECRVCVNRRMRVQHNIDMQDVRGKILAVIRNGRYVECREERL